MCSLPRPVINNSPVINKYNITNYIYNPTIPSIVNTTIQSNGTGGTTNDTSTMSRTHGYGIKQDELSSVGNNTPSVASVGTGTGTESKQHQYYYQQQQQQQYQQYGHNYEPQYNNRVQREEGEH